MSGRQASKNIYNFRRNNFHKARLPYQIPVSLASAAADGKIRTGQAAFLQLFRAFNKTDFYPLPVDRIQLIRIKISQFIFIQYIEVTGIHTAVCFHGILYVADTALVTGFRPVSH